MQQIRWGFVGCGNVTEIKSGPAFGKVDGSKVVAVMRRDAEKAKDYAKRHHIDRWYNNATDLINDPDVNAVYIATPPSSHAAYAIQAMEAGKIVYVEKPRASNYADCVTMNAASVETGVPLYVAYYRRFLPYFIKVKQILDNGHLGKILFVQVELYLPARPEDHNPQSLPWRVSQEIAGGGYFYDMACHQLDLLNWYFGNEKQVNGEHFNRAGLYPVEDLVFANILYESGVPLRGSWCFTAEDRAKQDRIMVFGTDGTLEFSTFAFSPIRIIKHGAGRRELPPNPKNIQYWFIRNMVEELRGIRPTATNGTSAANTNRIMDIILGKL